MVPFLFLPFDSEIVSYARWPLILAGVLILARALLPRSPVTLLELAKEAAIVIFAYFFYFIVRGIVEGRQFAAFDHATNVIHVERSLGIFWEVHLQEYVTDIDLLIHLVNWVYVWGHWPVIILCATWLFLAHREQYYVYRNAFLISGAIGLVVFGMLPVAPPRFMPAWGFVDTASAYHGGASASILVNEYAAMPSLHFGWNLLLGIAIYRHATWLPAKVLGVILPPAMFMSIVLTGNHFILDGLAGGTVALIALTAAVMLKRAMEARDEDGGRSEPPRATPALAG